MPESVVFLQPACDLRNLRIGGEFAFTEKAFRFGLLFEVRCGKTSLGLDIIEVGFENHG